MAKTEKAKPFGLVLLTEIPAAELPTINGGSGVSAVRRFHTMFLSLPSKAFPTGDSG